MSAHVVVVGASGLVGAATVEAFAQAGWDVTAVSRRSPWVSDGTRMRHLPVDLADPSACATELGALEAVTHLVYAAAFEKPGLVDGWSDTEQMHTNRTMLANVLAALEPSGSLRHVSIMQGTKAYGVHLHRIPLPAREDAARDPHPNFYWLQEDLMKERSAESGFDWTILRPVGIVGPSYGTGYSTPPVIGAYAAISRETGIPFAFPGGNIFPARQVVDVRLVADALVWAATTPAAHGQHFNLTNGEVFSWPELWPSLAVPFGLEVAAPSPFSVAEFIAEHDETWTRIADKYNLICPSLAELVGLSHFYADYTFGFGQTEPGPPALVSDVKIRRAGFAGAMSTPESFQWAIGELITRGVLPGMEPFGPDVRAGSARR